MRHLALVFFLEKVLVSNELRVLGLGQKKRSSRVPKEVGNEVDIHRIRSEEVTLIV